MLIKKIIHKLGINMTYSKRIGQSTFKVPIYNKLGFGNFRPTEPWMDVVLNKIGSENSKLLDIGTNVGQTLMKWKSLYPSAPYFGVEPNLQCAAYVEHLIHINNMKIAEVIPAAVANKTQLLELFTSTTDPSDVAGTTVPKFRDGQTEKGKKVVGLNFDFFKSFSADIIKIDVEGAESLIIESIFESGVPNQPLILCEILPTYNENNVDRLNAQKQIETTLKTNDYSIFRIDTNLAKINEIESIEVHSDLALCEYLFVHKNRRNEVLNQFNV